MTKIFILLVFLILVFTGCDMAMESLDATNGTKYVVTSKEKNAGDYHYTYHIIKVEDKWYDYYYTDTTDFNVGDTLIITIKKVSNNYGNNLY